MKAKNILVYISKERILNSKKGAFFVSYRINTNGIDKVAQGRNNVYITKGNLNIRRLRLEAILAVLREIKQIDNKQQYSYKIYLNDDEIAFEYNQEWLQDKKFSKMTKNVDIWDNITNFIKNNNMDVSLLGASGILKAINTKRKKK